jgi:hypothetical protein
VKVHALRKEEGRDGGCETGVSCRKKGRKVVGRDVEWKETADVEEGERERR